jgi:hypothetical protein
MGEAAKLAERSEIRQDARTETPSLADMAWFPVLKANSSLTASLSPEVQPDQQPPSVPGSQDILTSDQNEWALPSESLVLDHCDNEIPLNFITVYVTILKKFPGPPCESLGMAITYLQALFTESPAFHPYVTHLPSDSLPTNETAGRQVAQELERRLIRVLQHLFAFFYSDVSVVQEYIQRCPAELIPRPFFVISTGVSRAASPSTRMIHGVDGFNNHVRGGERVWQSPVNNSVWRARSQHEAHLENIRKCNMMIDRKRMAANSSLPFTGPSEPNGHFSRPFHGTPPQPPPRVPPPMNVQPPPVPIVAPAIQQAQFPPPRVQIPGLQVPTVPRPLPIPYAPTPPMQVPPALPQPNAGPLHLHTRVSSQPPPAPQDSPTNATMHELKADIDRLAVQMSRLASLISKDRQNSP